MFRKKVLNYLPAIILSTSLIGCKATNPPAPPQEITNPEQFEIVLPKVVSENEKTWNVNFLPFNNGSYGSSGIYDFYSVEYIANKETSEMNFSACNGEKYNTGSVYKSCVNYLADIEVIDSEEQRTLKIRPKLKTESKKSFIIPKAVPDVSIEQFFGYLSNQEIIFKGSITSQFNIESVKGNFDRLLSNYDWQGEADAAHRQFKDTYTFNVSSGENIIISAGFYPYRDGSIVEYAVKAISDYNPKTRKIDWAKVTEEVRDYLNKVVNN